MTSFQQIMTSVQVVGFRMERLILHLQLQCDFYRNIWQNATTDIV